MSTVPKKSRVLLFILCLVLLLGISFFTVYSTGIIPSQTRGLQLIRIEQEGVQCFDPSCSCHQKKWIGSDLCSGDTCCCKPTQTEQNSSNSIF